MPIILSMIYRSENIPEKLNTLLPKLNWDNRKYFEYQNEINKVLTTRRQLSPYSFSEIAEIIQEAHRSIATTTMTFSGREKWFNVTCFNARKKSFEYLDKFRKYASRENREKYVYFNKRYKEICENAKAQYNNRLERKIDEVKDSHDWWKIVRELRNEERCGSIPVKTEDLKNYFQQLLTHTKNFPDIHYAYIHWRDDDLDREICLMEVKKALGKAKLNKAPGEDRVPYEFYKYATDELLQEITCTCNVIFEKGEVDKSFVRSIIYPIFKKGDKTLPNNYRGISFMNCLPKVMMGIVKDRLANWSEKHGKINEYQAGFRKNYSTVDNLFNLSSIIHLNWHKNKKTYAFFVDFKAAFDRVSRKAMIYKLHTIGVSTKARNSPVILIQPQVLNRAAYYLLSYLLCTSMTYMNTLVVHQNAISTTTNGYHHPRSQSKKDLSSGNSKFLTVYSSVALSHQQQMSTDIHIELISHDLKLLLKLNNVINFVPPSLCHQDILLVTKLCEWPLLYFVTCYRHFCETFNETFGIQRKQKRIKWNLHKQCAGSEKQQQQQRS
ncbi:uncharacterized protein LOC131997758 [Stomoxys calcitrans]|uniref:uncharacterized protein LOC131997758 n=1 Tax=Stomoxys calcitrans TaxID=35570 RepID=UPI0027E2640E|nr:uncharacterized protein LOC131997758 [Stomoxys calcitrans]